MGRYRERFPAPAEINAIEDKDILEDILAAVIGQAEHMKAQLEQPGSDPDWRGRAINALALARRTIQLIERRIRRLGVTAREDDECNPLTLALMATYPTIRPASFATVEAAEDAIDKLTRMIAAAEEDRADEIGLPGVERDQSWLGRVAVGIREGRRLRTHLDDRIRALRKAAAQAHHRATDRDRQEMFIDAVRETHTKEQFLALWARVDEMARAAGG